MEEAKITRFEGLEEERPINIFFNVDMSGSMSVERQAVNEAILHFAETFNFRNRNPRLGLSGFSEKLDPVHSLTRSPKTFRTWMETLPQNAGGAGEDATHALVKSTQLMGKRKAERVVIMVTDEELQINQGGRSALA